MLPSAPAPRGNQSRRFPPSDKPKGSPLLRGLEGGIQAHSKENVKPTIALIELRSAATVILHTKSMDWLNLRLAKNGCFSFSLRIMPSVSYYRRI